VATNDVYKITCVATYLSSTALSSCHFRLKAATPDPSAANLGAVAADWINVFRPVQVPGTTWRSWRAVQVRGAGVSYTARPCLVTGGLGFEGTFTTNNGGTASPSEFLPPQCAVVSTLKTQAVGRSRRGRTYTFGMGEIQQTDGAWSAGVITGLQTAWATFLTKYGFNPTGTDPLFEFGIWSHRIAADCRPNPQPPYGMISGGNPQPDNAFTGIISATPKATVHTQRRRVAGVGI
jgi:hypothetical protein